ncbi:MAG TPA: O-methyltransferase [Paludibacter sp.]|nr:O-methyltransferase [Paludibacter sp.]
MTEEEYILAHSDAEPDYLALINRKTHLKMINPRMMSGHLQGRALSMFCSMIKPERILEIGTFTGYSALCMAETLSETGVIHTIERDDELEDFIMENFELSGLATKIKLHIGDAIDVIQKLDDTFDFVFIDGDKREYADYYDAVFPKVRNGGFILADNTLWDGKVLKNVSSNDSQTIEIMRFNDKIARDNRIEKVMLPLRDGLTIIRKK